MYGIKIIIALVILGPFNASVKGRTFSLQNDSPCFPNPCCQGKCRAKTEEEGYGYFCECREGFSGKRCEITGSEDDSACKDQCPLWAQNGECTKNPAWMKVNCRKSCQSCTSTSACADSNPSCPAWAKLGECVKNPSWMKSNCKLSCNNC